MEWAAWNVLIITGPEITWPSIHSWFQVRFTRWWTHFATDADDTATPRPHPVNFMCSHFIHSLRAMPDITDNHPSPSCSVRGISEQVERFSFFFSFLGHLVRPLRYLFFFLLLLLLAFISFFIHWMFPVFSKFSSFSLLTTRSQNCCCLLLVLWTSFVAQMCWKFLKLFYVTMSVAGGGISPIACDFCYLHFAISMFAPQLFSTRLWRPQLKR